MAFAARSSRPGASDGRTPCPVCRQQIHPVAGRCKHCKTDLVKLREQQGLRAPRLAPAQLGAPVPVAQPFAPAMPAPAPARLSGQLAAVDATIQTPPPQFPEHPSVPVAVQPSAQAPYLYTDATLETAPPIEATRRPRWPIIVAIVAGIAIVVCIILLATADDSDGSKAKKVGAAGVGPDRMDTQVTPPPIDLGKPGDPWGAPTTPDPVPDPDPLPPPAPLPPTPPPSTFNGVVPTAEQFYPTMIGALCGKVKSCGGVAASFVDQICDSDLLDMLNIWKDQIRAGQCTYNESEARKCLSEIDTMSCSSLSSANDFDLGAIDKMLSCGTALSCF